MMFCAAFIAEDLRPINVLAVLLILLPWIFYEPLAKLAGRGWSLNQQMYPVRRAWIGEHHAKAREHRVLDAVLLGHLSNSIIFFGSTTMLVLAGLAGSAINIKAIHDAARQLPFIDPMSLDLFTLFFGVVAAILVLCFFAFTYALRKLTYTFALIGALPDESATEPEIQVMVDCAAIVLTEAIKSLNNGIRGLYCAISALFLFAGPWISLTVTLFVTFLMFYRQLWSPTAKAIARYAEAMARLKT